MSRIILTLEAVREDRMASRRRRRRCMRDELIINNIPDFEFIKNYRLSRGLFEELCSEIIPLLPSKKHGVGVDPVIKVRS